jgi:hypothetical protein
MESMEKRAEQSEAVCGRAVMFCMACGERKKKKPPFSFSLSEIARLGTE